MEITGGICSIRLLRRALNALNRGDAPSLPLDGGPDRRTAAALRAGWRGAGRPCFGGRSRLFADFTAFSRARTGTFVTFGE
jgi:hypothetical protein